jgi:hypothetical protein
MAVPQTMRKMEKRNYEKHQVRCTQINLQHSRAATDNLMQVITAEKIGITSIQEPYLFQGRTLGITKRYRTFIAGEAIVISDNTI